MHLVKNDLVRVADTPESSDEGQDSDDRKADLVLGLALDSGPLSTSLGKLVKLRAGVERVLRGLLRYGASLSQAALLRRGASSHDGSRLAIRCDSWLEDERLQKEFQRTRD